MTDYDEYKVLAEACPKCGAGPEQYCRTAKGNRAGELHTLRKGAAYPRFLKSRAGHFKQGVTKRIK